MAHRLHSLTCNWNNIIISMRNYAFISICPKGGIYKFMQLMLFIMKNRVILPTFNINTLTTKGNATAVEFPSSALRGQTRLSVLRWQRILSNGNYTIFSFHSYYIYRNLEQLCMIILQYTMIKLAVADAQLTYTLIDPRVSNWAMISYVLF